MVTCKFNGRLGNNLFQIAATLELANRIGTEAVFPFQTWAGHREYRPVDLSMFNFSFSRQEVEMPNSYSETDFHYSEIEAKDDLCISGFYQSWKYFDSIKLDILNKYYLPTQEIASKVDSYHIPEDALGISIRRGDYLMLQSNHCVLSTEYYQSAIDTYFQNNISSIYIFSDDIEWCQQVFGEDVTYVQDDIGTQLFLMSRIKHLILSNSTFAWWGAYLNQKKGTIVVPDPWFGPSYADKSTQDLFWPEWIVHKHDRVLHNYTVDFKMYN